MNDKVAVIFHGICGGMKSHNGIGDQVQISECAATIHRNLLRHYDCDIFVHSWSVEAKDEIEALYKPTKSLYQPQEYFEFDPHKVDFSHRWLGQAFRTASRYTSLQRAVYLKQLYEKENNFKYKWVIVLRFDLVLFNKIELSDKDNNLFYGCYIPEWLGLHDLIFASSSEIIDELSTIIHDANINRYNPADAHGMLLHKLNSMFNWDTKYYLNYIGERYKDMEIYRFVMNPESIFEHGHEQYGTLLMKNKLEDILNHIDEENKFITKPWGSETRLEQNKNYVVKLLFMKKDHSCSLQYHQFKHETVFVIKGSLKLEYGNTIETLTTCTLKIGDHFIIPPKLIHRMAGLEDSEYLETSTNYLEDVIRLEDKYGRV